ncbi:MAG: hypothetical protein ACREDH_05180 [Methylocella sp.]
MPAWLGALGFAVKAGPDSAAPKRRAYGDVAQADRTWRRSPG